MLPGDCQKVQYPTIHGADDLCVRTTQFDNSKMENNRKASKSMKMTEEQIAQLNDCIPTLRAEYVAACYVLAHATNADDVEKWREWLLAAEKEITGAPPPMTDAALRIARA